MFILSHVEYYIKSRQFHLQTCGDKEISEQSLLFIYMFHRKQYLIILNDAIIYVQNCILYNQSPITQVTPVNTAKSLNKIHSCNYMKVQVYMQFLYRKCKLAGNRNNTLSMSLCKRIILSVIHLKVQIFQIEIGGINGLS